MSLETVYNLNELYTVNGFLSVVNATRLRDNHKSNMYNHAITERVCVGGSSLVIADKMLTKSCTYRSAFCKQF